MKLVTLIAAVAGLALSSLLSEPARTTLALSSICATKANLTFQETGKFSYRVSHLKPGEPGSNRSRSAVQAIRVVEPHADVTALSLNGRFACNKFDFAFAPKGANLLIAENDYLTTSVQAHEAKPEREPKPAASYFGKFAGHPEWWLVPIKSDTSRKALTTKSGDLQLPFMGVVVRGNARFFYLYQTHGSKREFLNF